MAEDICTTYKNKILSVWKCQLRFIQFQSENVTHKDSSLFQTML